MNYPLRAAINSVVIIVSLLALSSSVRGQCDEGCGAAECQGRCTYGVEGTCVPKPSTWGHYESTWRKWPVPAPAVTRRVQPGSRKSTSGQRPPELPDASDESELDPEFEHLDDAGPENTLVPDSMLYEGEDTAIDGFNLQDVIPTQDMPTRVPAAADDTASGAVDLPPAIEESGANDLLDTLEESAAPAPLLDFESRRRDVVPERFATPTEYASPDQNRSPARGKMKNPLRRVSYSVSDDVPGDRPAVKPAYSENGYPEHPYAKHHRYAESYRYPEQYRRPEQERYSEQHGYPQHTYPHPSHLPVYHLPSHTTHGLPHPQQVATTSKPESDNPLR